MLFVLIFGHFEIYFRQINSLELIVLHQRLNGKLKKFNPLEEVINVQQLVDDLCYFNLLFGYFPGLRFIANPSQDLERRIFDEMRKVDFLVSLFFKMAVGKGHIKEIHPKEFHEEEEAEESREYSSCI